MKFPARLENAINKLYVAFHNEALIPECPNRCAVGNVCDNRDFWRHFTDDHGSAQLNYVGKVNEVFGKRYFGYSPSQLLKLERKFLMGCRFTIPLNPRKNVPEKSVSKEVLFDGLCAAVSYLCSLDDVPDVMNYRQLFAFKSESTSKDRPEIAYIETK
ncbi:MAG: Na(+)-translocating NADH-quinone reductase subunit F [Flavobacteriaceae bacterium]|nr:Na(+)-translocating NADH-quinone reductase subunit F [Flavobacteriaceae bacterium]